MSDNRLKVVLLWHMHQPDYRDAISGEYMQPWTYLHGIKDYVDMAALLESNPNPTRDEARHALSGNLCRCGAYDHYLNSVMRAAQEA